MNQSEKDLKKLERRIAWMCASLDNEAKYQSHLKSLRVEVMRAMDNAGVPR